MKAEEHPLSQKPLIERITPGPWKYDKEDQYVYAPSQRDKDHDFMLADIRGWGHLQYISGGADMQDANGEAIARVPELLKAEQELEHQKQFTRLRLEDLDKADRKNLGVRGNNSQNFQRARRISKYMSGLK